MVAAVAVVVVLRLVLGTPHPRDLPTAVLVLMGAQAALMPGLAALSRRFERQADVFAIRATGDLPSFERVMRSLALHNLADLAPPRWAYWLLFTHPPAPERLALGRAVTP
jgi:STE24 endopeptidase